MKTKLIIIAISMTIILSLAACAAVEPGKTETPTTEPQVTDSVPSETAEPVAEPTAEPVAEPTAEPTAEPIARQDGERFDSVITIGGMEETVHYEHVRNEAIGYEIDYDYERFMRQNESGRERFYSVYGDRMDPENYFEVTYSAESVETIAATIKSDLSQEYDVNEDTRTLEGAGSCIRLDASIIKGTNNMADILQTVYIIPASDGCRIVRDRIVAVDSEFLSRRLSYMVNTLRVIDRK